MSNLTKYEKLQHRHLSLLKALADAGVEVSNQDGEWQIALPQPCAYVGSNNGFANFGGYPKCSTCHNTGKWCDGNEVLPCPAKNCPFRISITVSGLLYNPWLGEACDTKLYDPQRVVETYARERYKLKGNGDVEIERDALAKVPSWVRDFDKKWEMNTVSLAILVDADVVQMSDCVASTLSRAPVTPLLRNLLDALRHAMVPASPAKVD